MSYLIADSGSTKTSWLFIDDEGHRTAFETQGINPIRDNEQQMECVLDEALPPAPPCNGGKDYVCTAKLANMNTPLAHREGPGESPFSLNFYGAGCIPPYSDTLRLLLQRRFPEAEIRIESDLLEAAHALCGREEGIACILGTGSNSCLYDGKRIVENVSPLGYILGDEGSGAVLGKNLIGDLLKGQMSPTLLQAFHNETGLTRADIINKVYREPRPNRFLASLVPFLGRYRQDEEVHQFLVQNFRRFFRRNVALYRRPLLPVHFVGGVAHSYRDELSEAARLEGFRLGRILKRPIEALADYLLAD